MKNLRLINKQTEAYAKNKLSHFYNKEIIPPEKKEYITDLENSIGPFMGIEDSDAALHTFLMRLLKSPH